MERILCAAIWYKSANTAVHLPKNITEGVVIGGWRHHNCISTYATITGLQTKHADIQGFITSEGRFVDRKEAMIIAKEADQVPKNQSFEELYSEDIY